MARPSASMARPASVINCIEKPSPSARSASTACSMACALSGSSQEPNASTRCGMRCAGHQRGVAENVRLVVGRRPRHQNLRLRHQQRVEAIALGLERHDLVAERGVGRCRAQPRAHQHDGRDDREQQHAEGQRHGDDVAAIELREGVEIDVEDAGCGASRRRRSRASRRRRRIRIAADERCAPARRPDYSGISDVPLRSRCPLLPPTNHWDFTHKRNRAERVQIVNAGDGGEVLQAGLVEVKP